MCGLKKYWPFWTVSVCRPPHDYVSIDIWRGPLAYIIFGGSLPSAPPPPPPPHVNPALTPAPHQTKILATPLWLRDDQLTDCCQLTVDPTVRGRRFSTVLPSVCHLGTRHLCGDWPLPRVASLMLLIRRQWLVGWVWGTRQGNGASEIRRDACRQ